MLTPTINLYLLPVYLTIFAFGIVIGSFLNVCIYRIPKGETIVTTPSHCMTCGYHLRWYDLIPVFSWLFLRGRCRKCGAKISVQYPIVETCNGLLYVVIFAVKDFALLDGILSCLLASALLVLAVIDARTFEIPLGINLFILILGVLHLCLDISHWYQYLAGFFVVSLFLHILRAFSHGRAMGGGDVKLTAAAGLFLGWQNILLAFFIACILGAVIHTLRMRISGADRKLAFGPYLSAGILIAMLWGKTMLMWYGSTFLM